MPAMQQAPDVINLLTAYSHPGLVRQGLDTQIVAPDESVGLKTTAGPIRLAQGRLFDCAVVPLSLRMTLFNLRDRCTQRTILLLNNLCSWISAEIMDLPPAS
jgi:hypothetical protein